MTAATLRVIDVPPASTPVRQLRLVPQPVPQWRQLSLALSPADAPLPVAELATQPEFAGMPDVDAWVRQLVIGLIEALAGIRAPQQLIRWLDAPVFQAVCSRSRQPAARGASVRPSVSSVRAQSPRPGIVEATAVVRLGARYRSVALRLRADEGRWKCAELHVL